MRRVNGVKVALASPLGACAIGVVQITGVGAEEMLGRFFSGSIAGEPGRIRMGPFRGCDGKIIDQVLAVRLPGPKITIDITTHGGVRIVQRIAQTFKQAGAELVSGESLIPQTFHIPENLIAEEAYRLLPEAKTTLAVKFLLTQAHGGFGSYDKSAMAYWPVVKAILDGVKIVLAGPPNAGKSTLLNALARTDQAIVSELAGTTRDYIQASIDLNGLAVELVDTAGLGTTADPLAEPVRQKTIDQLRLADILLLVLDATDRMASEEFLRSLKAIENIPALRSGRALAVLNKIDRPKSAIPFGKADLSEPWPMIEISALQQSGLGQIGPEVWRLLGLEGFDYRKPTVFSETIAEELGHHF